MHAQLPKCCALKLHTSVRPIFLERDPFILSIQPSPKTEGPLTASLRVTDLYESEVAGQFRVKGRANCRQSGDGFSLVKFLAPSRFRVFQRKRI